METSSRAAAFQAVSGNTRLYGVMGYPVAHSLSPQMQTFAFRYYHLDCLYVPFPVAPQHLATAVAGAVALGVGGFNVTIPHKETILRQLDEVSEEARMIGAVNTVQIHAGRTRGYNTDGEGFLYPLRAVSLPWTETSVCVLGAGGAARAITIALLQAGCPTMVIVNRTYSRGACLAATLQARFPRAQICAVPLAQAARVATQSRLVVNATAVGLQGTAGALLPDHCFHAGQIVYDIVYRPIDTPLLQAARRRGATVVPGIDMLIGQGAAAFRLWTGLAFPVAAVRRLLQPLLQRTAEEEAGGR